VSVVRRVRIEVEPRQRSLTHLIRYAARLLVAPRERAVGLQASQPSERRVDHGAAIDHRAVPAGGERVAAEECGIEWHPGLRRAPQRPSCREAARARRRTSIAPRTPRSGRAPAAAAVRSAPPGYRRSRRPAPTPTALPVRGAPDWLPDRPRPTSRDRSSIEHGCRALAEEGPRRRRGSDPAT